MSSLRDLDIEDLKKLCHKLKQPLYRASQIADWLYKKDVADYSGMRNLPKPFLDDLSKSYNAVSLRLKKEVKSKDGSRKYLFRTRDRHYLESVFIPHERRSTVCLSTQLGCRIKCVFCASGKGRFVRNLTVAEILDQLSLIRATLSKPITNVVFMGMGEPLDNPEALFKAVRILNASWGYSIGARRITISTIGYLPGLKQLLKTDCPPVRLAFSLHSSRQAAREKLIPVARKYPLDKVIAALKKYHQRCKRDITLEYVLLEGVNDSAEDMKGVAGIARSLGAKVNLIPINPVEKSHWRQPSKEKVELFRKHLDSCGVRTTLRRSLGSDISAACGQLRLLEERK